jgi:transcriptional regulator with XRE-family HTH domain
LGCIARHRREAGLTQEQLAEKAGINVKSLQGAEQGWTEPELRTMRRIARALTVGLDALANSPSRLSRERLVAAIHANVALLPVDQLEHVAAVVAALARSVARGKRRP